MLTEKEIDALSYENTGTKTTGGRDILVKWVPISEEEEKEIDKVVIPIFRDSLFREHQASLEEIAG